MTFLDHGPTIEIVTPEEGAPESALGAVAFEYEVRRDELVPGDTDAEVAEVSLTVMGERFEMVEREGQPGLFRTTVDFSDPELFEDISTGAVQVAVSASNLRDTTRTTRYDFVLDGTGPKVTIALPVDTAIVGGTVALNLTVTDSVSSVDWDTLTVRLNDLSFHYDANGPWRIVGDAVTFTFETGEITGSIEQITVNVNVDDVAGNASPGAAVLYYRDELAPIVSMDPPNFRAFNEDQLTCSLSFDPLGVSPENGQRVPDLAQYRALVVDRTNSAAGADVLHLAYVDPDSVDLFVRRHGEPLVIDTTKDGVCDDIAEAGARFQELTGLAPTGVAPKRVEGAEDDSLVTPVVPAEFCTFPVGQDVHLCRDNWSDLTMVVAHSNKVSERTIYAVSPDNDLECTGRRWELSSAGLADYQGWVCLAVRALDNVGNRGVSKPIAVCLDNSQVEGEPACKVDLTELPPDCTDGCSDPPALPADGVYISQ